MARGGKRKGAGDKPGHPYRGGGGRHPNGPPYYPWEAITGGYSRRAWYANDYHLLTSEQQIEVIHRINAERERKAREEARKRAKPPKRVKPVEIKIPADRRYGVDRKDVGKLWEAAMFDQQKQRRKAEFEEYMNTPASGYKCPKCKCAPFWCECSQ
jgi:hypothetical protein